MKLLDLIVDYSWMMSVSTGRDSYDWTDVKCAIVIIIKVLGIW
jgi:hypothetical protein